MTSYFDDWDSELHKLSKQPDTYTPDFYAAWQAHEEKLVWDVTLAAESPGFPADLREAVHRTIVEHAVESRPINSRTNLRVDDLNDVFRELGNMSHKLHTIFHEVSQRGLEFSDSPLSPMRMLFSRGDEFREALVEAAKTSK